MKPTTQHRVTAALISIAATAFGGGNALAKKPEVGVNLAPLVDWSTSKTFVDLMRSSRKWLPQTTAAPNGTWNTGAVIDLDSNGWPRRLASGQAASTLMVREIDGDYPAGRYTVLYDGEGVLRFDFDARVVSSSPGKMILDVTPTNNGIFMSIVETNPSNYIRNVRVIMPGFENNYDTQIFHPDFLKSLEGFDVIRFMDWQATNNSRITQWSERTTPQRYSQAAPGGVSVELMVELANRLDKDAWFCIPHLANDDYVRNFAATVANLIEPDRKVYIEHSNEVWNSQFKQYRYASQMGQANGWGNAPWTAAWKWHSFRSVQIFDIVDDYFPPTQLVRTMGSQAANWYITKVTLEHNEAWRKTDAVAIAPYFSGPAINPNRFSEISGWTVDQVVESSYQDITQVMGWVDDNIKETEKYGIQLVAYEGGQHLAPISAEQRGSTAFVNKLIAANRHPRMRAIFTEYLERWHAKNTGPMVLYNHISTFDKYGSWGLKERQSQTLDQAPKYGGTMDFIAANATGAFAISDMNTDGVKDINDVTLFISYFQTRNMIADLATDQILDTGDIMAFVSDFAK